MKLGVCFESFEEMKKKGKGKTDSTHRGEDYRDTEKIQSDDGDAERSGWDGGGSYHIV